MSHRESSPKPNTHRPQRVADLIREEIAQYLISGVKDPRIGFVTVTNVKITPDLSIARVLYTAYGSRKEQIETTNGLIESSKEIRMHLGKTLKLRHTPKLEFFVDEGLEHSYHINELLGEIAAKDGHGAKNAAIDVVEENSDEGDEE